MIKLFAPQSYKNASDGEIELICNGCGSAQAKFDFIPDTVWGLSITPACNVHDWMYYVGLTQLDKEEADMVFLNNMLRLIEGQTSFIGKRLKPLRRRRVLKYYEAVVAFGGPAYWNPKNES